VKLTFIVVFVQVKSMELTTHK